MNEMFKIDFNVFMYSYATLLSVTVKCAFAIKCTASSYYLYKIKLVSVLNVLEL